MVQTHEILLDPHLGISATLEAHDKAFRIRLTHDSGPECLNQHMLQNLGDSIEERFRNSNIANVRSSEWRRTDNTYEKMFTGGKSGYDLINAARRALEHIQNKVAAGTPLNEAVIQLWQEENMPSATPLEEAFILQLRSFKRSLPAMIPGDVAEIAASLARNFATSHQEWPGSKNAAAFLEDQLAQCVDTVNQHSKCRTYLTNELTRAAEELYARSANTQKSAMRR
ncbi:MAG: hypothetical protein KGJ06_04390 [Pseudomonadota bacterium]|nr:hypothetical protein [Pseudomonadota bacterium]